MAFDDIPKRLEAVFVQRTEANDYYEQINISASNAIVYLYEQGKIDVSRISDFMSIWAPTSGGGGSSQATQSIYATQSLFATSSLTASNVPYDGNRAITRNDPFWQGVIPGGTDVVKFLDNFFYPFNEATITLSSPSPGSTFETGSVNTITLSGYITRNSETVYGTTGSVKYGSNVLLSNFASASTFSVQDVNASSSKTYTAYMTVNSPPVVISSTSRTVNYYFPYLWGMSTQDGLTGSALYNACTRTAQGVVSSQTVSFIGSAVYMYFCYPIVSAGYPITGKILDPNLFNITTAFGYTASVAVTSSGLVHNWMANYQVYRTNLLSSPNGNFIFSQS